MAEGKITAKSVQKEKEQLKTNKVYKVIYGPFAKKIQAIEAATVAKKNGFYARIVVEKGNCKLIYTEEDSRASAEATLKVIAAVGLNAEISESD